ncbi:hypothetical protein GCM10022393_36330 [Aquimarina addita]|uniref:C2H2-type domain-containing protein n=1 Tax=Aquimarina addita TaxID=870485 RepID=A0ABP6UR31_9FLAO
MKKKWYQIGILDKNLCSNCNSEFQGLQTLDHHSQICPSCKIECIWFSFKNEKTLQIIPEFAPKEFQTFIKWAQKEFDEIEFLELILSFEEIAEAL